MDKSKLEYRMYGLVPYNLSPIQQGIQFGHAVVEYGLEHFNDEDYQKWATEDKTFIILNGGTTNTNNSVLGTLNEHMMTLLGMEKNYATFYEPDLGDQLTAVVFLVDERVWDKEKYPDPYLPPITQFTPLTSEPPEGYEEAIERMGGEKIYALREFLKQFSFA